jgi:hypothetical protein
VNGPESFTEGILQLQSGCDYGCPFSGCVHEIAYIARAQAHLTAALVAVTFATGAHRLQPADRHEWLKATDPEHAAEQAPGAAL